MSATGQALPTGEARSNLRWARPEVTCTTRRWLPPEVPVHCHPRVPASRCPRSSNSIPATNSTAGQPIIRTTVPAHRTPVLLCQDILLGLMAGPALATSHQDILVILVANSIQVVGTTPRLLPILSSTHSNTLSSNLEWFLQEAKECLLLDPPVRQAQ